MKCLYALEACQIENLDCESIFPVAQWLLDHVLTSQGDCNDEVFGSIYLLPFTDSKMVVMDN